MKPSERILSYCAIIITLIAITIWLQFMRAESKLLPPAPLPHPVVQSKPVVKKRNTMPSAAVATPIRQVNLPASIQARLVKASAPAVPDRASQIPRTTPGSSRVATRVTTQAAALVDTRGATIIGQAAFFGTPPPRAKFQPSQDCIEQTLLTEDVLVNANGTLRNVFVYLDGMPTNAYAMPPLPAAVDLAGCRFEPHVLGMQSGQLVEFNNSDRNRYSLQLTRPDGRKHQLTIEPTRDPLPWTLVIPTVMYRVTDDYHPWMSAYVGVLPHPFFRVTQEDGTYIITGIPPGQYSLIAWHETYGVGTQQVILTERETKEINFEFRPR